MAIKNRKQRKKKKRTGNRSEYWQECGKKQPYTTKKYAEWAATNANKRGDHCHTYKCRYCDKWHISSDC
jgi:hypothetical protein